MSCEHCNSDGSCILRKYNETYDSNYCGVSGNWLEDKCGDTACDFCINRPTTCNDNLVKNELTTALNDLNKQFRATGQEIGRSLRSILDKINFKNSE